MAIKIAIIDDSQQMKTVVSDFFKNSERYDLVLSDGDGASAFDEIAEICPDVVLLDLILPNKDGFAVLEQLKSLEVAPKVIITTALMGDSFVHKAMQMGASDYIVKPFDIQILDEHITSVFNNKVQTQNLQSKVDKLVESYIDRPTKSRNMEERISNIFITVGIPAHIKGYQFLREAIKMAVYEPDIVNSITKKLYPSIAEKFNTSPSKVERAIRHAIEVAWNRGKIENINSVFGLQVYNSNDKPTNGEFIALVADKMIIEGC